MNCHLILTILLITLAICVTIWVSSCIRRRSRPGDHPPRLLFKKLRADTSVPRYMTAHAAGLDLAAALNRQTADWADLQGNYAVGELIPLREFAMYTHVVNNAQGVKAPAAWFVTTGDPWHRRAARQGKDGLDIRMLFQGVGQPVQHVAAQVPAVGGDQPEMAAGQIG